MSKLADYFSECFLIGLAKVEEDGENQYLLSGHLLNHTGILLTTINVFIIVSCLYMFWDQIIFYATNKIIFFLPSAFLASIILGFLIYKGATIDIKSGRAILMDKNNSALVFYDNWLMKTKAFEIDLREVLSLSIEKSGNSKNPGQTNSRLLLSLDNQKKIILAEYINESSDEYIAIKKFLDPIII